MKKLICASILVLTLNILATAQKTVEKAYAVPANSFTWVGIQFPKESRLSGSFRAQGGSRNDIEVYIIESDEFENLKNGNEFSSIYSSGRRTTGKFDLRLPAGDYMMILNNRFSLLTSKAVTVTFTE